MGTLFDEIQAGATKDESKIAIDAKDLASGIVEALSGNKEKDAKKES